MSDPSVNEGVNRQLYLKRVPEGIAGPGDFETRTAPIPATGPGEVLVEAHYLSVDAALRLIVRDSDEFLFRVRPGDLVRGSMPVRSSSPITPTTRWESRCSPPRDCRTMRSPTVPTSRNAMSARRRWVPGSVGSASRA